MLNQCTFIGHLGADPESRSFASGGKVVNLRLAVSERWKDKSTGEQKEKTEWVPVSIFSEGLANVAERYLRKGSKVLVSGKFQTRKYQDQAGADRYSTEIILQGFDAKLVMLDSVGDNRGANTGSNGGGGGNASSDPFGGDDFDEVPFITNRGMF